MILRRLWHFKKDIKAIFSEILLPICVVIFGFSIASITFYFDEPSLNYSLSFYPIQ